MTDRTAIFGPVVPGVRMEGIAMNSSEHRIATPMPLPDANPRRNPLPKIDNFDGLPWEQRLTLITQMMRDVSSITDAMEMVDVYGEWVQSISPTDGFISLSRRDLLAPNYKITRSHVWEDRGDIVNPWRDKLPTFDRGLLGELIHKGEPTILDDFTCSPDDPACEHLNGFRSLQAMPLFEDGVSVNMIISLNREPNRFDRESLPQRLWMSNLFGRATKNLVLNEQLRRTYDALDREMKTVADIQRSLLPPKVPSVEGITFATHYQTSTQAGGDYYDFFELPDGRIGILIADVSGHGTPAAVVMAITHSIAHATDEPPHPPSEMMTFINRRLAARYTNNGTFVTAFYGLYDPKDRTLRYCNAGHNPPIVRRNDGPNLALDENHGLPLGIVGDEIYTDAVAQLKAGDVLILYTDGITEARHGDDTTDLFGVERLEQTVCACEPTAEAIVGRVVKAVNQFSDFAPATDDRTLVVARLS